jgi:hypothetical protein
MISATIDVSGSNAPISSEGIVAGGGEPEQLCS